MDTSALIAITNDEPGSEALRKAVAGGGQVPAPALVEYQRVVTKRGSHPAPQTDAALAKLLTRLEIVPFTAQDAAIARAANDQYGSGNGRGGTLNLLDLMVYAVAKRTGRPILCTGRDFAATGISVHPASRLD